MTVQIESFKRVVPMIYAYKTPGVSHNDGWIKIGYTERQTVEERINQQTQTANIRWDLVLKGNAIFKDGSGVCFTDHDFHAYLVKNEIKRKPSTEWFQIDSTKLRELFDAFSYHQLPESDQICTYELRREQREAVEMTMAHFSQGGKQFLWNAKPRFGKTLTSYDLIRQMGFKKILIVTNRPAISNSWVVDFRKFIAWDCNLAFVSENDALKGQKGVVSYNDYNNRLQTDSEQEQGMVAFESLQGLKGSIYFGGNYDKLKWISELEFDLLIVDEAQEGVDTVRTDRAFSHIRRKHTLYLSGTPFKALASDQFSDDEIFNWSYADEQTSKETWNSDESNPYEHLPRLAMYTYQISPMICDTLKQGIDLSGDDEKVDYAFDLNEFFTTDAKGKFVHEEEVKKFLHALSTNEKYPFSTPELRNELRHTLWLLNRVASAKALAALLSADPVFSEYKVVLAAGDGQIDDERATEESLQRVENAIKENEKTITLSVGQLTVGVTIPQWSGVLMLCNLQSSSAYMQAAFRAQNPCQMVIGTERYRKETAYVFDFDPTRTLIIFDEFANNLSTSTAAGKGTSQDRKDNIGRLLNFFPVIGEDEEGRMVEFDASQILSIPRRLKSQEVVRRGFISNFLFHNIGNIFGAPSRVGDILSNMPSATEDKKNKRKPVPISEAIPDDDSGNGNDNGNDNDSDNDGKSNGLESPKTVAIGKAPDLFGPKIYEDLTGKCQESIEQLDKSDETNAGKAMDQVAAKIKEIIIRDVVDPIAKQYGSKQEMERQVNREIKTKFDQLKSDFKQQTRIATAELKQKLKAADTPEELANANAECKAAIDDALREFREATGNLADDIIHNMPDELMKSIEEKRNKKEKEAVEDSVRAHLRGFARTIPSFIMAYGDENLTLQNFDEYTEDDVFKEVTGISEDDFRFLRDGGSYDDPETGEEKHFEGHLFDETVFNDSIQEFWKKKKELENYFDESHDEDIFDYIPPQKTNQIFTPRWVVKKMVDALEENNPGCFDDANHTFADLYMKSGLYITEIVKRLFRSEKLKQQFPSDGDRIRHILRNQVYGMAPTRIIYLIATNYILGFDDQLKNETKNFVQADAAEAAKDGTLSALIEKHFG